MRTGPCNDTCCQFNGDQVICFTDYNFTDSNEITEVAAWELAVRWTIVIPMVLCGVLGNLTIIIILLKNRLLMRTSVNIFILNMAVSDMILAIAGPIPFTIRCTHQFWVLGELWCHLDGLIEVTLMEVSVNSLAIISIDRLLGIFYVTHKHLKRWKAFLIIACIWVVSSFLGVPFFIYRNYGVHIWADLTEVYCEEVLTKTKYYWIAIIVFLNWVPLVVMTISYVLLFTGYKKHTLKVEGTVQPSVLKRKKRFLKMLFANVLAFALCWLPFQAFIIYREKIIILDGGQVSKLETYDIAFNFTQYTVYLYPVINPLIYGFMHQNFRYGFRVTFPCFFKDEADLVLTRGHGWQAYVWSGASSKKTVNAISLADSRRRVGRQGPRRTFSVNDVGVQPEISIRIAEATVSRKVTRRSASNASDNESSRSPRATSTRELSSLPFAPSSQSKIIDTEQIPKGFT